MTRRLVIRPEAVKEISEAASWYEERAPGLAAEFLRSVDVMTAAIRRDPHHFIEVQAGKRRALLQRFPYALIFTSTDTEIVLLACMHSRRHPSRWQQRS